MATATLQCPCCSQPWPKDVPTRLAVGFRVRLARELHGLSQTELGQRLARPRSHVSISELERGIIKIDIDVLAELAKILDTPLTFFVDGLFDDA